MMCVLRGRKMTGKKKMQCFIPSKGKTFSSRLYKFFKVSSNNNENQNDILHRDGILVRDLVKREKVV